MTTIAPERAATAPVRPAQAPKLADTRLNAWLNETGAPPLFVEAIPGAFDTVESSLDWVRSNEDLLNSLVLDYGVVVLRGFGFRKPEDFNQFALLWPKWVGGYIGGASPRSSVVGIVLEATRLDPKFTIGLHQEMSYLPRYPSKIAFFGNRIADEGGATTIGDMVEVSRQVPAELAAKIQKYGVRCVRNYGPKGDGLGVAHHIDDKPWNVGLGTDDKEEAEAICASMGIEPYWNEDGSLTVVTVTPGYNRHTKTGELIYHSNIHTHARANADFGTDNPIWDEARKHQKFHTGYLLGNGEELSVEEQQLLEGLCDAAVKRWQWQQGDIMLLDNLQIAHGRDPFKGNRDTLVTLLA